MATCRVQDDVVFDPLHRFGNRYATCYDERIAHVHLRVAVVDGRIEARLVLDAVGCVTGVDCPGPGCVRGVWFTKVEMV